MSAPLDLHVGGFYRRRDGVTAGPLRLNQGMDGDHGPPNVYPWLVPPGPHIGEAYSVDDTGRRYCGESHSHDLIEAVTVTNTPRPGETPEQTAARSREPAGSVAAAEDPAAQLARLGGRDGPAAAEAAAPATTERGPATIRDDDMLAVILEEARREAEAMLGRAAPTTLAIARMVGPGYPLGDAVAAIRNADQMAFAGMREQAVDLLSEAIAALAVASVVIREGRE